MADSMLHGPDETVPPPGAETLLRVMPLPADTFMGNRVSAGWVLSKLELAGGMLPRRVAARQVQLVRLGPVELQRPLTLGAVVVFEGVMAHTTAGLLAVDVWGFVEVPGAPSAPLLRARLQYRPLPDEPPLFAFTG